MLSRALDLEPEQLSLSLEEPGAEAAHLTCGKHETSKPEHRTVVVLRVRPADIRTDVSELVQVREVRQKLPQNARKPAPERGPRKEGKLGPASQLEA